MQTKTRKIQRAKKNKCFLGGLLWNNGLKTKN